MTEGRVPRRQKRAKAAAAVFQPIEDEPPRDVALFRETDRAPAALERELIGRIFSPIIASATVGWNVPAFGLGPPPTMREPIPTSDYTFQDAMPGGQRQRTWDWIAKNATLFFQSQVGSPYYLRAKNSDVGVDTTMWSYLFPTTPRARIPAYFRTFELINVSDTHKFNAKDHLADTIYFEVDLASRTPDHDIPIEVHEADQLETMGREVLEGVAELENPLAVIPETRTQLSHFVLVLALVVLEATTPRILDDPQARIVLTYEVHSSRGDESILLSKGLTFVPDPNQEVFGNLQDLALRILHLIWEIRDSVLVEHYEVNGMFVFHPRSVRIILSDMPAVNGEIFTAPPRGLIMPKGGCMSVNGMPKSLMELLAGVAVSHDVFRPGVFFDNNCGIREALIALGMAVTKPGDVKTLFELAAHWRASVPGIPPFVKLDPQQLYDVISHHTGNLRFYIHHLPTPSQPVGHLFVMEPEEMQEQWEPVHLVLSHEHYFGLRGRTTEERAEQFERVRSIRYCLRCKRYCIAGESRVSHDFEIPSELYPACKHRRPVLADPLDLDDAPSSQASDDSDEAPLESSRTLRKVSPAPPYLVTPHHRVGFMDLETWRPMHNEGFHEVYAVGWIKMAKEDIVPDDVLIYSSVNDPFTTNAALVHALVDLIAFITADSERYTKKKPYYLYFYNGSGFDNLFLLHTLASHFKMLPDNMALKDGRLMTMTYLGGALVIRDLCLFTLCSLKAACKIYNVEDKLAKGNFDHESITSLQVVEEKWEEIRDYLSKDLTALNMVFLGFQKAAYAVFKLDFCSRITMSHLSYDYWNSTLSPEQREAVTIPKDFSQYQDVLRAYYGGRVFPQVKRFVSEDRHLPYKDMKDYLVDLDVVSLYPSAMWYSGAISKKFFQSGRNIPLYFCGEPRLVSDPTTEEWNKIRRTLTTLKPSWPKRGMEPSMDYWRRVTKLNVAFDINLQGAIVCVNFKPNRNLVVPLLPHKNDKGDTAWDLLPHEKQWYVLEEILDAIYYGYEVTKFWVAYVYPKRVALFDTAMRILMEGKRSCQRGDPKRDQYKTGANSIYGKHAQKATTEETTLITPAALEATMEDNYVLSLEPICNTDAAPMLQAYKKNRPSWVNDDPDLADELADFLESEFELPVDAFVVKTKPKNTLPSKPTYLGAQVTAYSRIHMNWFLYRLGILDSLDPKKQLYYTDTDSLIVHASVIRDAPVGLFGNELGQLDDELEGGRIFDYSALAPKSYTMGYRMPTEVDYMKIRAKGFPHTKETLHLSYDALDLWERPRPRHVVDDDFIPEGFNDSPGIFTPENLGLGQQVYAVHRENAGTSYYNHLNPSIFADILAGHRMAMTVYFTSLRKCYFGVHALGHVSGIKHCHLNRTLTSATWWDGTPENPHPHRKPYGAEGVTLPVGHALLDI